MSGVGADLESTYLVSQTQHYFTKSPHAVQEGPEGSISITAFSKHDRGTPSLQSKSKRGLWKDGPARHKIKLTSYHIVHPLPFQIIITDY